MFNQGISKMGDLLDIGVNQGLIKKAGAFYSYGDTRLGQGRENSKAFLSERSDIADEIEALIRGEEKPEDEMPDAGNNGTHAGAAPDGVAHIANPDGVSLN
jgi:recombination protein RecA